MSDVDVQHLSGTIAGSSSSVTLTAGTDYTAPSVAANAWIVIRSNNAVGEGQNGTGFGGIDDWGVHCSNPGNIATSLTFERGTAHSSSVNFRVELHEYVGGAGGDNEIEVLATEVLSFGTSDLTQDTTTQTPSADENMVVQIAGSSGTSAMARGFMNPALFTGDWIDADNDGRATRGVTGSDTAECHVNLLDYSGPNWTIQRVENSYAGTTAETQSITSVGSMSRAFCEFRQRGGTASTTGRNVGEAYLSAVDELTFQTDQVATTNIHAAYVIGNSQTDSGAMDIQRINGTQGTSSNHPETWTDSTFTDVSDLAESFVSGITARTSTGTQTDSYKGQIGAQLTAVGTVTFYIGNNQENRVWRCEIGQWPEASSANNASGSPSIAAITATGNADRSVPGSGSVSIGAIEASGNVETGRDASGNVQIGAVTASGVAERTIDASGAVSIPSITASGAASIGEAVYNASGDVTIPSLTATGQSEPGREASGNVSIPSLTAAGNSAREAKGSGNVSIPAISASGLARMVRFASGAVVMPAISATGQAAIGGEIVESPFYGTGYIIDAELTGCVIDMNGMGYVIDFAIVGVLRGED